MATEVRRTTNRIGALAEIVMSLPPPCSTGTGPETAVPVPTVRLTSPRRGYLERVFALGTVTVSNECSTVKVEHMFAPRPESGYGGGQDSGRRR